MELSVLNLCTHLRKDTCTFLLNNWGGTHGTFCSTRSGNVNQHRVDALDDVLTVLNVSSQGELIISTGLDALRSHATQSGYH